METNKILTANLIDIVFEGRNKTYGAYELRKNYEKRLVKALLLTALICLAVAGSAWLKSIFARADNRPLVKIHEGLVIEDVKPIEEKKVIPPPLPPAKKIEAPKVQSEKFVAPVVTADKLVVDPPPTQDDMKVSKIGNITQSGIADASIIVAPEGVDNRTGLIASTTPRNKDDGIFHRVEIDAQYSGNWKSFLERNLSGDVPVDNGAPASVYTVIVQFIVDAAGNVSDIKALTNIGYGMEAEAIRVIKKSGKWRPAIQNGREVKAYRKQPITFQVLDQ